MACAYTELVTESMAADMAGRLSPLDVKEIKAGGNKPKECLVEGVRASAESWAYLKDGRPYVIAGIRKPGLIWMLSARDLKQPDAKWFFARRAKRDLDARQARWGCLGNLIWKANTPHMRLLEWLDFEFGETVEVNGHDYVMFRRGANV